MSGQSKVMSTILSAFAALLVSSVAVSAAVGPVQVAGERTDVVRRA